MKISARNQIPGVVRRLNSGPINAEVVVELPGGQELVAVVTRASVEALELTEGRQLVAVIKSSNVMLAVE